MTRRMQLASVALMAGTTLGLAGLTAGADKEKAATIKEVMQKINGKGNKTASAKLKAALKAETPDWTAIQEATKVYAELTPALGENEPPRGSAESWKKLSGQFAETSKALDDAAQSKDLEAVKAASKKIGGYCMPCHTAHKKQ